MNNEERAAVQKEQNFFRGLITNQKPSSNCITGVRLRFDSDGDLFFEFSTATNDFYAVCVVLNDRKALGWKECQALSAAMQMAERGSEMSPIIFGNCLRTIAQNLGRVDGPNSLLGVSVATVIPGASSMRVENPDTIVSTSLDFDNGGDILLVSRTKRGAAYVICIRLHLMNMALTVLEGKAFSAALQLLETGDILPPHTFLVFAIMLKDMFNNIHVSVRDQQCIISMLPTPVKNNVPLPDFVFEAAKLLPAQQSGQIPAVSSPSSTAVGPYGNIRVIRPLKESGQAQVFEATKDSKKIALKVYMDLSDQPEDSFKNELKMLLKMSYHPNVVTVLDFFEKPKPAIAMEFIEGQDLFDFLEGTSRLSEAEGLKLVIGIAEGLYHLHKNNIVHLDMKSPNILRRTDGSPVIIDLGLSAVFEGNSSRSNRSGSSRIGRDSTLNGPVRTIFETYRMQKAQGGKGSLLWMAPEMLTDHEWSDRTDVYAFGIIMWEVFSGKQPFLDDLPESTIHSLPIKIATGFRPSLSKVSHIDGKLQRVMTMCWHPDPKQRPTMMRVLDILRRTDPKALFESFDHDGSGELEYAEFVRFLEKYAAHVKDPDQISALFKAIDANSSGAICFNEFESFWSSVQTHGLGAYISNQGVKKRDAVRHAKPKRSEDCKIQ
ncbi:Protein kinase [Gracilaria domingensis]|nr:Protein kinase [Gracilaria domingensis]